MVIFRKEAILEQREVLEKLGAETLRDMIVDLWAALEKERKYVKCSVLCRCEDPYSPSRKQAAMECYQIVGDTMEHLASPIAPYNHGVLDAKIAARKAIKEKFGLEI